MLAVRNIQEKKRIFKYVASGFFFPALSAQLKDEKSLFV